LREAGLIAQSDYDTARANADTASAQVRSAAAAIERLEQTRAAAQRRVAQGRAEVARARDQLVKTDITAPIDGVITRLDVEEGEMVVIGVQNQPGTILMTVSDLSSINAEVKVAEADVLRLKRQATGRHARGPAGPTFAGKVVEIGASALPQVGTQAAAREFRVKVRLEGDTASRLRPGLTCDAEILVAERTNVLTVPLQSVVQRPGADGTPRPACSWSPTAWRGSRRPPPASSAG
jgi:HlyD family secretion protein